MFTHSPVDEPLGHFHCVFISLEKFLGVKMMNCRVGMFYYINNCPKFFWGDCTISHFHQQDDRVLIISHSHQHLAWWAVFLLGQGTFQGIFQWCLIGVTIFICLILMIFGIFSYAYFLLIYLLLWGLWVFLAILIGTSII